MRNFVRNLVLGLSALAVCSIAAAAVLALVSQSPMLNPQQAPAPRACSLPWDAGSRMPSGDAATDNSGREWVCTDGTLVRVTGYGN